MCVKETFSIMKLIVSDLDGTLLDSKKEISKEDLKTIEYLKDQGHIFTFATSRYMHSMKPYIYQCDIKVPVIGSNGSFVYDYVTNEIIYKNLLERELVQKVIKYASLNRLQFLVHTSSDLYLTKNHIRLSFYRKNNERAINEKEKFYPIETDFKDFDHFDDVFQIGIISDDVASLKNRLQDLLKSYTCTVKITGKEVVAIVPPDSSKALAIEILLKKYQLSKEDLIVFGDDENDLSMFEYAIHSVAMANAKEIIKAKSEFVSLSNDESGFSYAIKNFYEL